jgi:hypothetical protein
MPDFSARLRTLSAMATQPTQKRIYWSRRVGWMLLIWAASVIAMAVVAFAFRLAMSAAGLKIINENNGKLARPERFERPTLRFVV